MAPDSLRVLHDAIAARAGGLATAHAGWPCRKGCDACCRRLAAPPRLSAAEWDLLHAGIQALPEALRGEVAARVRSMPAHGPIVCPFLHRDSAACLVYEHRPVACRTYGFYRERDRGLYCEELHARVEHGEFADAVWGNAASIEHGLLACGGMRDLHAWFFGA